MTRILGIETSCDETAAAIVEDGRVVRSSIILSQIDIHQKFGGVVPEVAARAHLKVIDAIVEEALQKASCTLADVDAIAVTQGPGLIGALLVGIAYAKGLALASGIPLVPVNHVEAHVHGALLGLKEKTEDLFPCLALVVSGGHSNIYFMNSPTEFELMAYSIDDACGESFDKVAKLFGLGYPGGPAIERLARDGDPSKIPMPKMMEQKDKLQFSYSGLKTFMVNMNHRQKISGQALNDAAAAFQEEALGQLVRKLETVSKMRKARCLLVAGGVAANQRFRGLVHERLAIPAFFPQLSYCSDNAAMIAALGYHHYALTADKSQFQNLDWDAFSRYQFA
ncbi:MAG: tRNA (adenosine(37)-N6)-threonylcarbamoyltransferase complex transferase subunit TsaD [Bdellovibrionota bacterium]|nr:MAG: tRNA (adenosine(37)-N6)-threonylcarbamoyltransferase complex transferase subunit TsaD [Pseudomonadota bacterium]